MRSLTTIVLLLAALLTICFAKPIHLLNLDDIERRWYQGESESSIHAQQSYRDATPAWTIAGKSLDDVSWDERSAAARNYKRKTGGSLSQMKAWAERFYEKKGMLKKAKAVKEMSVPVLKPKRGMKYPFVA